MKSLRARLFAATLVALAVTLALTIGIGALLTRRQVDHSQAVALAHRADDLAEQRRENVSYVNQNTVVQGVRTIVAPRNLLVFYVPNVARSSDGETTYDGERYLYSYRTLPERGLLLLTLASVRESEWHPFLRDLLLSALAGAVLAALLSFLIARSITGPIRRVANATRDFAADELPRPLEPEGASEVASLAQAFNEMAARLSASREAERDFFLSVSHELKTPLTAIRGYAEGLADGAFDADEAARVINAESGRLERLVRDLLDLARMNRSTFSVSSEPVDAAAVAREAVERHRASAQEFGVTLGVEGTEAWVVADEGRLLQIASNLVENALRETPAGGSVTVIAAEGMLRVADTGPGIPGSDVGHAFDRFYLYDKIGKDRPVGSGLGLAIVKQLALAMGGGVSVESGPGGTTFSVALRPQVRGVDDLEVGAPQRA